LLFCECANVAQHSGALDRRESISGGTSRIPLVLGRARAHAQFRALHLLRNYTHKKSQFSMHCARTPHVASSKAMPHNWANVQPPSTEPWQQSNMHDRVGWNYCCARSASAGVLHSDRMAPRCTSRPTSAHGPAARRRSMARVHKTAQIGSLI